MTLRVLVTGGMGFVGNAVIAGALAQGFEVRASSRRDPDHPDRRVKYHRADNLGPEVDWTPALQDIDVVVHCAARAHIMTDSAGSAHELFRTANVDGTLDLALQAAAAGVKRFVYMSSIGVNGLQTAPGQPFSESDKVAPHNAYAMSKWEAEQGLWRIAEQTGLEVVIIRPPLVYGPGAPGNFGALTRAVRLGWPLPLGAINNKRSLVGLDNLVDFILTCARHPMAANQVFLVSDGENLSTSELVRGMARVANRLGRCLPVPFWILQTAAVALGKRAALQRLTGNLEVNISKSRSVLGWIPPVSIADGLHRAFQGKK